MDNYDIVYYNIIRPSVIKVREKLHKDYDTSKGYNERYMGLCDIAVEMLRNELRKVCSKKGFKLSFKIHHGEIRHTPKIESRFWPLQHTWCEATIFGIRFYIDPTCEQFYNYEFGYDLSMPSYYISIYPPEWFYDDRHNPAFNGITGILNNIIRIKHKYRIKTTGTNRYEEISEGIVEFVQYSIWSKISDLFHILYKNGYLAVNRS